MFSRWLMSMKMIDESLDDANHYIKRTVNKYSLVRATPRKRLASRHCCARVEWQKCRSTKIHFADSLRWCNVIITVEHASFNIIVQDFSSQSLSTNTFIAMNFIHIPRRGLRMAEASESHFLAFYYSFIIRRRCGGAPSVQWSLSCRKLSRTRK